MDKDKKIKELMSKGFTKNQAAMICMSNESMQQGGVKTNENKIAPQRPIKLIQPVSTEGYRDNGRLAPGDYQKVYYTDPQNAKIENQDYEYLTSSGYDELKRMNNYRIYMEQLNKPKPIQQFVAMQKGGQFSGERFNIPQNIDYSFSTQLPVQQNLFENTGYANYAQNLEQKYPIDKLDEYNQYNVDQNFKPSDRLKPFPTQSTEQTYQQNVDTTQKPEIYNPFGGVGLEESLYMAGQGFGENDPWKVSLGTGLSALKIGRTGLSGYATGKENARIAEEMRRKQFEDMRRPKILQQGGVSNAAVMTGQYIVDQPNGNTNVEVEHGEQVKDNQTGEIKKVVGDKHKDGGVSTQLDNAKILSDYTKIGAKNAKELKDKYNLSIKKTDTFAKVMDKVNKNLGVDELVKEQTEYIEKLGQNETIKSEGTKKVNDEFLNKEIKEKEDKLNQLKGAQNFAFEDIFSRQEQIPKKGEKGEILNANGKPIEVKEQPIAQQGGHIIELAKKHGLSIERAQELMTMQQGGVQSPQEEQMEGQSSNAQEEQGEISPEQIVQEFAQATQQDPNTIMQQLQQMSPEEQQAALQQMVQQLQGQQSPQEEQTEGNNSNPQEEGQEQPQQMMQLGGYTKEQQASRLNDFYSQVSGLGYSGKKEIGAMQNWMASNYPNEVVDYFTKNGQPLTVKHVDIIKDKYKNVFKETGISANKKSEDYTAEEKLKLQTALGDKVSSDFLLQGFKDNKWDWRFPMIAQQNVKPIQGAPNAQIIAPSMARFASPQEVSQETPIVVPEAEQVAQEKTTVKSNMVYPNMPMDYLLPPSAMQAINKPYVPLGRIQPIKLTAEPMLAESARQAQTSLEALRATGLPPQIQEALAAQQLATTQGASNDAIAKTEQFNAQNQFQADQFNISQASKEDLMNTQYAQDYQDKMMATLSNQERDMRRYYNELNNQNRANFNYVDRRNIANQAFENFSTTGSDVTYNPSTKSYHTSDGAIIPMDVANKILAEQEAAKKDYAKRMKNYKKE